MTISTKYEVGMTVWFLFSDGNGNVFYEGIIEEIDSWDRFTNHFSYTVSHINTDGVKQYYQVLEYNIYESKEYILNSIFKVNNEEIIEETEQEELIPQEELITENPIIPEDND